MTNIIHEYIDSKGSSLYAKWLGKLRDAKARARIILQVDRMELGLFGDFRPVGKGLSEIRIHYDPGFRVYYAKPGKRLYLLLCAGNKTTQAKDIKGARALWKDYQQRNKHDG